MRSSSFLTCIQSLALSRDDLSGEMKLGGRSFPGERIQLSTQSVYSWIVILILGLEAYIKTDLSLWSLYLVFFYKCARSGMYVMARVQATSLRRIASLHNSATNSCRSTEGADGYLRFQRWGWGNFSTVSDSAMVDSLILMLIVVKKWPNGRYQA